MLQLIKVENPYKPFYKINLQISWTNYKGIGGLINSLKVQIIKKNNLYGACIVPFVFNSIYSIYLYSSIGLVSNKFLKIIYFNIFS